jgi:GTPase SAR1 family protein
MGVKVVTVGPASCGKTCLILEVTRGTFNGSIPETVGGDSWLTTFQGIELDFWNTAGQE